MLKVKNGEYQLQVFVKKKKNSSPWVATQTELYEVEILTFGHQCYNIQFYDTLNNIGFLVLGLSHE